MGMTAEIVKDSKVKIGTIRDLIWLALWKQERDNSRKRLESYNPKLILNCCTKELKKCVTDEYMKLKTPIINVAHPASWNQYHIKTA